MTIPLHEQIRTDFEKQIMNGELKPGDRIAVEHELMQRYECSRMTVNKALSALSSAGFIERRRRAGSFVARPKVNSMVLDIPDLSVEVTERGQQYGYRLLERQLRKVQPGEIEEKKLAKAGKLLQVDGLHLADDVPLALELRLVNSRAVPGLLEVDLAVDPVGSWLLRHVPWTDVKSRISAVAAREAEAELLELEAGAPCLQVERWTWQNTVPVTYVRTVFVGSAYALVANFGAARP